MFGSQGDVQHLRRLGLHRRHGRSKLHWRRIPWSNLGQHSQWRRRRVGGGVFFNMMMMTMIKMLMMIIQKESFLGPQVINGGFGLVLDGSEAAAARARSMLGWDVSNGVARFDHWLHQNIMLFVV